MSTVHIDRRLSRAEALAALFNAAKPQGLGKLQYNASHVMDELEAEMILAKGEYVDYLEGRVIKTRFDSVIEVDTTFYDRDNGKDAGERALFEAIDKKEGGFFSTLKLPVRLMGHKVTKQFHPGAPSYVYDCVMGGTLTVMLHDDIIDRQIVIQFEHHDLNWKYCSCRMDLRSLHEHDGKFEFLVKKVINTAMNEMMKHD